MQQIINMEYINTLKEMYWLSDSTRYEAAKAHLNDEVNTPQEYEIGIKLICDILEI